MTVARRSGKWMIDVMIGGVRIRRTSPVQTKQGARQFEIELVRSGSSTSTPCSSGTVCPVGDAEKPTCPTIASFAKEFLTTYAVVNNKPSEVVGKEGTLRNHLLPFFEKPLNEITTRDIEGYKAQKLTEELCEKTINNHLAVLRKLMVTAQEWGLIDALPRFRRLKLPAQTYDWLNREESERFLDAVQRKYPQWYCLFLMALRTGMRRGEIFALRWDNVDLTAGIITVQHTVFRGRLVSPKNGRLRRLPMTSGLIAGLKEHRAKTFMKGEFVFPAENGTVSKYQDHVERPLVGALKLAGLRKIRFHDLRHSFASQLVAAGRSLKEVQELLGHATITMTLRYAHLAPGMMREAVDALEGPSLKGRDGTSFGKTTAEQGR